MPEDTFEDIRRRLFDAAWELPAFPPEAPRTVARARRRVATTIAAAAIAAFAAIALVTATLPIDRSERTGRTTRELEDHEFLVDLDSGSRTELKGFPQYAHDFARSPDGDRLAFVSDVDHRPQIWVSELDGSSAHPVTADPLETRQPSWSPDGREIVYVGFGHGSRRALYIVSLRSGSTHLLYRGPRDPGDPAWSPDGRHVVFDVAVPSTGSSPDDGRAETSGGQYLPTVSFRLEVVDVGTGAVGVVAGGNENAAYDGSWLRDGRIVYVRGTRVRVEGPSRFALWTANADGTSRRSLGAVRSDHFAWSLSPSPDGSKIAYSTILDSRERLFLFDTATGTNRPVGLGWYSIWIDDHTLLVQQGIQS